MEKKLQYGSMVWLPSGEKTLMIYLAISTEHWRVTDGHSMHTRRAVEIKKTN